MVSTSTRLRRILTAPTSTTYLLLPFSLFFSTTSLSSSERTSFETCRWFLQEQLIDRSCEKCDDWSEDELEGQRSRLRCFAKEVNVEGEWDQGVAYRYRSRCSRGHPHDRRLDVDEQVTFNRAHETKRSRIGSCSRSNSSLLCTPCLSQILSTVLTQQLESSPLKLLSRNTILSEMNSRPTCNTLRLLKLVTLVCLRLHRSLLIH